MSKVIHISNRAHERAKAFCRDRNTPMSDWVASLIEAAAAGDEGAPIPLVVSGSLKVDVVKKKRLDPRDGTAMDAESLQAYASPPFWVNKPTPRA